MSRVLLFSLTASINPTLVAATTVMLLLPSPKKLMLGYLLGAYTTSIERVNGTERHAFELAIELAAAAPLEDLVGATYGLSWWRRALDHAFDSGRLGTFKVAFDPRER